MKSKLLIMSFLMITIVSIFIAQSCTKEDEEGLSSKDVSLAQDEAFTDALFEEVDNMVSDELFLLDASGYTTDSKKSLTDEVCYTVTVDHPDSTFFPKVITLDYGDGCQVVFNGDTIVRKGQINIEVTGRWFVKGSQHIISFNNFYLNGVKIEGTKTRTNLGYNAKRNQELETKLTNGRIIFNDSLIITREASHVREMIRSLNSLNDTIKVTGTASGINVLGQAYTREIIEPLVMVHCAQYRWRWIIADGKVELTNSETGNLTIDYSGSGCDGEVTISKEGESKNYSFKYIRRG